MFYALRFSITLERKKELYNFEKDSCKNSFPHFEYSCTLYMFVATGRG